MILESISRLHVHIQYLPAFQCIERIDGPLGETPRTHIGDQRTGNLNLCPCQLCLVTLLPVLFVLQALAMTGMSYIMVGVGVYFRDLKEFV